MSSTQQSDYQGRIHRVMDHIERHLAEPMTLEELARVAAFSPYHFHRIFSAITGETLARFIGRLRLERAAAHLVAYPDRSITEVAYDNGFSSPSAFSRAFKAHYGFSATTWRKECEALRKDSQALRKQGEDGAPGAAYPPGASQPGRRNPMTVEAQNIRVQTLDPMTVAYVRHVGPYAGDEALFQRLIGQLCRWAGPRGHLEGETRIINIYHDNPDITDEDKLRLSVCLPVPAGTAPEGEVGVMDLDGGPCALAHFEIHPHQYGEAWKWLYATWLPESGYEPDDRPCYELFTGSGPSEHPEGKHVFDICLPVRPA